MLVVGITPPLRLGLFDTISIATGSTYTSYVNNAVFVNNISNSNVAAGRSVLQMDTSVLPMNLALGGPAYPASQRFPGIIFEAFALETVIPSANRSAIYTDQKSYFGTP